MLLGFVAGVLDIVWKLAILFCNIIVVLFTTVPVVVSAMAQGIISGSNLMRVVWVQTAGAFDGQLGSGPFMAVAYGIFTGAKLRVFPDFALYLAAFVLSRLNPGKLYFSVAFGGSVIMGIVAVDSQDTLMKVVDEGWCIIGQINEFARLFIDFAIGILEPTIPVINVVLNIIYNMLEPLFKGFVMQFINFFGLVFEILTDAKFECKGPEVPMCSIDACTPKKILAFVHNVFKFLVDDVLRAVVGGLPIIGGKGRDAITRSLQGAAWLWYNVVTLVPEFMFFAISPGGGCVNDVPLNKCKQCINCNAKPCCTNARLNCLIEETIIVAAKMLELVWDFLKIIPGLKQVIDLIETIVNGIQKVIKGLLDALGGIIGVQIGDLVKFINMVTKAFCAVQIILTWGGASWCLAFVFLFGNIDLSALDELDTEPVKITVRRLLWEELGGKTDPDPSRDADGDAAKNAWSGAGGSWNGTRAEEVDPLGAIILQNVVRMKQNAGNVFGRQHHCVPTLQNATTVRAIVQSLHVRLRAAANASLGSFDPPHVRANVGPESSLMYAECTAQYMAIVLGKRFLQKAIDLGHDSIMIQGLIRQRPPLPMTDPCMRVLASFANATKSVYSRFLTVKCLAAYGTTSLIQGVAGRYLRAQIPNDLLTRYVHVDGAGIADDVYAAVAIILEGGDTQTARLHFDTHGYLFSFLIKAYDIIVYAIDRIRRSSGEGVYGFVNAIIDIEEVAAHAGAIELRDLSKTAWVKKFIALPRVSGQSHAVHGVRRTSAERAMARTGEIRASWNKMIQQGYRPSNNDAFGSKYASLKRAQGLASGRELLESRKFANSADTVEPGAVGGTRRRILGREDQGIGSGGCATVLPFRIEQVVRDVLGRWVNEIAKIIDIILAYLFDLDPFNGAGLLADLYVSFLSCNVNKTTIPTTKNRTIGCIGRLQIMYPLPRWPILPEAFYWDFMCPGTYVHKTLFPFEHTHTHPHTRQPFKCHCSKPYRRCAEFYPTGFHVIMYYVEVRFVDYYLSRIELFSGKKMPRFNDIRSARVTLDAASVYDVLPFTPLAHVVAYTLKGVGCVVAAFGNTIRWFDTGVHDWDLIAGEAQSFITNPPSGRWSIRLTTLIPFLYRFTDLYYAELGNGNISALHEFMGPPSFTGIPLFGDTPTTGSLFDHTLRPTGDSAYICAGFQLPTVVIPLVVFSIYVSVIVSGLVAVALFVAIAFARIVLLVLGEVRFLSTYAVIKAYSASTETPVEHTKPYIKASPSVSRVSSTLRSGTASSQSLRYRK